MTANYKAQIEAILFAQGDAVEAKKIASALEISVDQLSDIVSDMQKDMEERGSGLNIVKLDDSYQMCTRRELYDALIKVVKQPRRQVLTDVMMETLSIIAYKQPVTKAEIEKIRGVKSDFAVNKLVEYMLVEEVGRLDTPGRPILFGTTKEFLRRLGIGSKDELPAVMPEVVDEFTKEAENEVPLKERQV